MIRKLLVLAALLGAGCRTLPFPDPHYEGRYGQVLKKWTRTAAVYSGLETRAFVRVVYLSDEFVSGQAAELADLRAEKPDQATETAEKMRDQYRAPTIFAVVYVPDKTANDWNERDSVWRIALNLGIGEHAPDKVERFDRPFNAELKALYPYLDEYSVAYRIRFPEPSPTGSERFTATDVELVVAGAPGKMVFHWSLDGRGEDGVQSQGGPSNQPATSPKP